MAVQVSKTLTTKIGDSIHASVAFLKRSCKAKTTQIEYIYIYILINFSEHSSVNNKSQIDENEFDIHK